MKSAANRPTHVTRGNVLDDLGFSPEQATALKFKAELYQAILKYSEKYSQKELQVILGEPLPRVSELLNGKIANKSVDKLFYYAGRLGIEAIAKFTQTHKEVVENELAMVDTHNEIVEGIRKLRKRIKPGKMSVRQMVEEGRRF